MNSRETGAQSSSCAFVGAWRFCFLHNTAAQWCRVKVQGQDSPSDRRFLLSSQVFKWTGNNSFFLKGDLDSLMMGCGRCVSQSSPSLECRGGLCSDPFSRPEMLS